MSKVWIFMNGMLAGVVSVFAAATVAVEVARGNNSTDAGEEKGKLDCRKNRQHRGREGGSPCRA